MYQEIILQYSADNPYMLPQPPSEMGQIHFAEEQLKISFPEELWQLLMELNGDRWLLLSVEEIAETNLWVRKGLGECYDGLDQLLFVARNGCGDYYGYRIVDGIVYAEEIVFWEHETNESKVVAGSLAEMITLYYTDRI